MPKGIPPKSTIRVAVFIAPDGGYGWWIVLAAFWLGFISEGCIISFSVYIDLLADHLNRPVAQISVIGSTQIAVHMLTGPLASALIQRVGFRRTSILGVLLQFAGYLSASFSGNYVLTLLLYGVTTGLGGGLIFMATIILTSLYFERLRVVATGITLCGASFGTFIWSMVARALTVRWGLLTTLQIQSAMILVIGLAASMVYRKPALKVLETAEEGNAEDGTTGAQRMRRRSLNQSRVSVGSYRSAYHVIQRETESGWTMFRKSKPNIVPAKDLRSAPAELIVMRPLDRMDVYFAGSVVQLNETIELHKPLDFEPERRSSIDPETVCCQRCRMWLGWVASQLDLALLKSPTMQVITLSMFLTTLGQYTPYMMIVKRSAERGTPLKVAEWLLPSISTGMIVGRFINGLMSVYVHADAVMMSAWPLIGAGSLSILTAIVGSQVVGVDFAYAVAFGLLISFPVTLRANIFVMFLGLERLTSVFGLVRMFMGFGALAGTPITQKIHDNSDSYVGSFVFSGLCHVSAGILTLLLPLVEGWESARYKRRMGFTENG